MHQAEQINKNKQEPYPINDIKKSEIKAPKGPPKLLITGDESRYQKPESDESYDTNEIKIYNEKAIRKKLKKLVKVFFMFDDIKLVYFICVIIGIFGHNFFILNYNSSNVRES